jgi:hypothetical protein
LLSRFLNPLLQRNWPICLEIRSFCIRCAISKPDYVPVGIDPALHRIRKCCLLQHWDQGDGHGRNPIVAKANEMREEDHSESNLFTKAKCSWLSLSILKKGRIVHAIFRSDLVAYPIIVDLSHDGLFNDGLVWDLVRVSR